MKKDNLIIHEVNKTKGFYLKKCEEAQVSGSETWQFFLAKLSSDKKFWLLGMFTTLGIS